jgi:hypothetical protein
VDCSDSSASEHCKAGLWHHWHVDYYSISLLNLEFGFQDGSQFGDIFMQLFIGISFLNTCVGTIVGNGILVTSALFNMSVNSVVTNIHLTIWVPSVQVLIACIQNFCEFFGPDQIFGLLCPETFLI